LPKRLIEFIRSVLPADPYQLLFLTGIVCLMIAHGLTWWRPSAHDRWSSLSGPFGPYVWEALVLSHLLLILAAMAGYFICFWPGNHPVRRISAFVIFPAASSLILTVGRALYMSGPTSTILQSSAGNAFAKISWVQNVFWHSPGATVAFFGLLLSILFTFRLAFGISTLPLALSGGRSEDSSDIKGWPRLQRLICFLVALTPVPIALLLLIVAPIFLPWMGTNRFSSAAINFGEVMLYVIASLIAGPEGRKTIREYVARPRVKWLALALFLPIAIDFLVLKGQSSLDYLQHPVRANSVPLHESVPLMLAGSFFLLFVPAFVEEAIFRGLLQARFVLRYGLFRGIFLVNIAWAAFHFYSDFSFSHKSYLQALDQLFLRIFMALAIGFVLSWMTLQSHSIIPAAVAHALYNALVNFSPGPSAVSYVRYALWAAAAYILFKYWPISENDVSHSPQQFIQAPAAEE
jgi:membrane protease YdiL (CAAX protease family)